MNYEPLVSVIITTYKRPQLLLRALNSVINQEYKNIEIIISDDCSNDETFSIVEMVRNRTSIPIIFISSKENRGACFARNKAFSIAKGILISGLDDDDEFTPCRLKYLVDNYDSKYSFIATNTTVVTKEGKKELFGNKQSRVIKLFDALWENQIGTQVLVDKERLLNVGGFDTSLPSSQDANMWLRLIDRYGPALRLKKSTYILHTEHDFVRISTSEGKLKGLELNFLFFKNKMNSSQQKYGQLRLEYWKKNKHYSYSMIKFIDIRIVIFLLKKKFKLI